MTLSWIIQRKARWPRWTPTANMIRRDPRLQEYANGMEPGLDNPLVVVGPERRSAPAHKRK
jgi:lipoprotein-anchoring transpeptidase ErfK/SrfK